MPAFARHGLRRARRPPGRQLVGDRAHTTRAAVITLDDVQAAARRLDGVAHRTPVLTGRSLDEATGAARVLLKAENLQRVGAFKFRGAYNAVASLSRRASARAASRPCPRATTRRRSRWPRGCTRSPP